MQAVDAAEGMRHLHDREPPIVHRDLKSPNLVIAADYTVKVCDFNLSKILDGDSARSSSLAAMNPRWLAPELFNGESATRACDVFSFGVVLWELIAWDVPWGNKNPWTVSGEAFFSPTASVASPSPADAPPSARIADCQHAQQRRSPGDPAARGPARPRAHPFLL